MKHWTDKYISQDPDDGQWICWDQYGDYIGMKPTLEEARGFIEEYARELEEYYDRTNGRRDC